MAKYQRRIKRFGGQHQTLPIKDKKQLEALLYYLLNQIEHAKSEVKEYQAYRNYMLVLIGVHTAFRAEDLLQLRVFDVISGQVQIKENKTQKSQIFQLRKEVVEQIKEYVNKYDLKTYDYMFLGQKKKEDGKPYNYPITRDRASKIVSNAGKAVGINFTFALHSLRKTFGYQYMANGGNLLTLCKMYNHDHTSITEMYVMWGKEDAEKDRQSIYLGVKTTPKKISKNK